MKHKSNPQAGEAASGDWRSMTEELGARARGGWRRREEKTREREREREWS